MSITFLGDVYLPEAYDIDEHFEKYVFNLEYVITSSGSRAQNKVNLRSKESHIRETFGGNPVAVSLANNHAMDYGEAGLVETLQILETENISAFGAGPEEDNFNNPVIITESDHQIGLLGYCRSDLVQDDSTVGVAIAEEDRIKKDIEKIDQSTVDRIVVNIHWGAEDVHFPRPRDVRLARQMVDWGADLIIGHHTHCIQPWEIYNGSYIFYGLGNCIMPNITIQSYYNESGKPQETFDKTQRWWNRNSIAVNYDSCLHKVTIFSLQFKEGVLAKRSMPMTSKTRNVIYGHTSETNLYPGLFKISQAYGFLRMAIINRIL